MPEEEKTTSAEVMPQSAEEYAAAIKKLKENTVSKAEYEKLQADKTVLVKALAGEGPAPESVQEAAKKPDVKELRKKFLKAGENNLTNAETVQTALDLRAALLAKGEPDPFLPVGAKISPTVDDIRGAEKVAEAMQSWLDASKDENGIVDDELFNAYLKKGIADDSPAITARIKAMQMAAARSKKR
ncbi:MAG: hypothetical protein J6S85_06540 [Methanobrevibacter sp.]|nr:hypothetical protein [Methanobrevibacter sp.]